MLSKTSVFMMMLIVTASLVAVSTVYQPTSVTAQPQQQRSGTMIGKVTHTIVYASTDGKACLANAEISPRLYHPNYPLGLKPGNHIMLLTMDESICDSLSQASIAQQEIQFRVALAPLTLRAIPPTLREDLPPPLVQSNSDTHGTWTMIIVMI